MSFENALYNPMFYEEWERFSLHELADWKNGLAFKNDYFCNDGKPVIKIAELKNGISDQTKYSDQTFDAAYHLTKKDLLFSWSGSPETSIDAFWYDLPDGWLNQHIFKVTPFGKVTKDYMFYVLKYLKPIFIEIAKNKQTTGLGHVTLTDLKNIMVRIPKKNEQYAIAATLSALDDKIELNNRINKTLEEMAQALFKRWFVDFEFPDENGLPYKSSGGEIEESELGLIPKGWDIIAFDDFIVERKEKAGERDIPEYSSTNSGLFPRSEKFKKQLSVSQFSNKVIRKNDLVFGMSRQILNWGIMFEELGAVSAAYHVFEVNQALVDSHFLELLMKNRISYFADIIKPAAREGQGIDKSGLKKKTIYIPPIKIFEEFQRAIMSLQEAIKLKTTEIDNLTSLRAGLLPKLMSGEIRVPIEEVAADV